MALLLQIVRVADVSLCTCNSEYRVDIRDAESTLTTRLLLASLSVKVPVNVGLALVALLSNVVCRLVPLGVIAGAVSVPVNVGFAFGALSNNSFSTFVPSTTNGPGDISQAP